MREFLAQLSELVVLQEVSSQPDLLHILPRLPSTAIREVAVLKVLQL